MSDQLLILLLVFGGITIGGFAVKQLARRKRAAMIESLQLEPDAAGRPRIVSFFGPSCDACDQQKEVLADLQRTRAGSFVLDQRDATVDYEYARQFGLMVVPTTVVVAANGSITAINTGFTARATLEAQLAAA